MRKVLAALSLAALVSTTAAAQSWHTAIGIQGGFSRIKPAGTGQNDAFDGFDIPGSNFVLGALGYSSLYAIIPVADKIALEPSFGASQVNIVAQNINSAHLGLRADYAFTRHIYGAVGAELIYIGQVSPTQHAGPLAVTAGVGYRMALSGRLNGRLEARFTASQKSTGALNLPPLDVYALLFGVSTDLGAGRGGARGARMSDAMWSPVFGVSGGYFSAHFVGGPAVSGFALPGVGSATAVGGLGIPLSQLPSLFAVIPVGNRLAIEPGLNFDRLQVLGGGFSTVTSSLISVRADLAVSRTWYAGLGPVANYFKASGSKGAAQLGVSAAWGARFHIVGDLGGRLEASYSMFAKHRILGLPPVNTLGFGGAVTMGL